MGWILVPIFVVLLPLVTGGFILFQLDILHDQLPRQAIINHLLTQNPGMLPSWNPFSFCGAPLVGDPQFQIFYPPAMVYRFLSPASAQGWFILLHWWLAATGMYSLLLRQGMSPSAAVVGALSFTLGLHSFMLTLTAPTMAGWAWIPWLGYFSIAKESRGLAHWGLATTSMMQHLAGLPQYSIYGIAVVLLCSIKHEPFRISAGFRSLAWFLLGILLASASMIPSATYIFSGSTRAVPLPSWSSSLDDMEPGMFLQLVNPLIGVGGVHELQYPQAHWATIHFGGTIPFLLALSGFRWAAGATYFTAPVNLIMVGGLLSFGKSLPFLGTILQAIPPFSYMRHGGLWMVLVDLSLAWMAARGYDLVFSLRPRRLQVYSRLGLVLSATCVLIFGSVRLFGLVGWTFPNIEFGGTGADLKSFWKPGIQILIATLVPYAMSSWWRSAIASRLVVSSITVLELTLLGYHLNRPVPANWCMAPSVLESKILNGIPSSRTWCRIALWPAGSMPGVRRSTIVQGKDLEEAVRGIRQRLRANLPAITMLRDIDGSNPLVPKRIDETLRRLDRRGDFVD